MELSLETLDENPTFQGVMDIHPREVQKIAAQVRLIDVRQPEEYAGELGHIQNATLMPLESVPEVIADLDRNNTYVFICRSGGRSGRAAAFAQSLGFDKVFNMKGGMLLWNQLQLPTVKD